MSSGIHLVIFCAIDYKDLLDDCLNSAFKYIQDDILSVTIVSNGKFETDNLLILDKDFWKLIDPEFKYSNLYKHNWVKQQILKLNLDKIIQGNILVCDVEVRFKNSIRWCNKNKFNMFYVPLPINDSANFVFDAIGKTAVNGFVTESIIFSSYILESLRNFIEKKFDCNQLDAYRSLVYDFPESETPELKVFMSEYELYANYVINYYPEYIWNFCQYNKRLYHSINHDLQTKDKNSNTQWISFYEQIKGPNWPDCYKEDDFGNLPDWIQKECIEVHGYNPK